VTRSRRDYQALIQELVDTLIGFAGRHQVTTDEYRQAAAYLTEVGRSDEMILLGDALRLSVAIDDITHRGTSASTPWNVEGPFYLPDNPMLESPYRLSSADEPGDPLVLRGRVTDAETGEAIPGSILDLWQASADGWYEQQKPDRGPFYLRGKVPADDDGAFVFRTVVPGSYEIPKQGPVGQLLAYLDRHAFRANHIHLKMHAQGYEPLLTQIFFSDNEWLDSDTIGAVKEELVVDLTKETDEVLAKELEVRSPFFTATFDISLNRRA
jgi:protocatechuate 3,4-dioxygenase beta subunit